MYLKLKGGGCVMKLSPAQLHSLNELKMRRCSLITKTAVYRDSAKSKHHTSQVN